MKHRLLTEFGMGSSLRRLDYTAASEKALKDALWHNSINLAELFGKDKEDMIIDVEIACQAPDTVDTERLKSVFPYGQINITTHHGGLDIPRPEAAGGNPTIMAHAVIHVSLELERAA